MRYGCFCRGVYLGEVIADSREDALAVARSLFGEVTSVATGSPERDEGGATVVPLSAKRDAKSWREIERLQRSRVA